MNITEYAELAMRTQAIKENKNDMLHHGVLGLASEAGEIVEVALCAFVDDQEFNLKLWNSNRIDRMLSEIGDALWFMIEIAKSLDIDYNLLINDDSETDSKDFKGDKNKLLLSNIMDLSSVCGYISGRVQKIYQGRELDVETITKCLSTIFNLIIRIIKILNSDIDIYNVMEWNIEKLKARFPQGFDKELDAHRKEGDL